ncbi:DNA replication/checkpoint protein [Lipomyces kononenkoae]|uniref:DNA replication/checkpoint protein n=1 Tax=Lipomyces kononenkoae TaxID=34357 RepID=A0ACC3T750_LIPKO
MTKSDLEDELSSLEQLKIAIKSWEHEFRNKFGRQPEKQDIKQNPDIASKYKEYHRAKRSAAGSKENSDNGESHSHYEHHRHRYHGKSRRHWSDNEREASPLPPPESYHTPKRARHEEQHRVSTTPTKSASRPEYDSPGSGNLVGRRQRVTAIGPTPQVEGRVLGIFDITNSPEFLSQTVLSASPSPEAIMANSTQTKASCLMTPSKVNIMRTPQSVTPSYFRPLNKNKIYMTPSPLKPKKVSRGLTALLAELRQMQDEEIDEQESIMRDMELGMPEINNAKTADADENVVGHEDVGYHLGEIKEGDTATIISESKERVAMMEKIKYKKAKTQKRTTRRVLLRPAKPTTVITASPGQERIKEAESSADDCSEQSSSSDSEMATGQKAAAGEQDNADTNKAGQPARRVGGVSQNFKRLKMRSKSGKRFGKRHR